MSKVYDLHKFKPEKVDAMERWARRLIRRADDTAQECGQAGDVSRSDGLKGFQAYRGSRKAKGLSAGRHESGNVDILIVSARSKPRPVL